MELIEPFHLEIPQAALDDLKARLAAARWPDRETVDDWTQGVPLEKLEGLCRYWQEDYDWRRCEGALNGLGQFRTVIDDLGIHFLHIKSPESSAMPLLLTHGWPGSILEFMKVVGPLTDPAAHGGSAEDAFHLVIPSLPGYGFSDRPVRSGWGVRRIASAWAELVRRVGYADRWVAQGGDWGSLVTSALGHLAPQGLAAIHVNMPLALPSAEDRVTATEEEKADAARFDHYVNNESAYARLQTTRPQTLSYGLADSPIGQAAWIYEKLVAWTDCHGAPENVLTRDEMLDNISLYWLTMTAASSARLYWESMGSAFVDLAPVNIPAGASIFPGELFQPSRRIVERRYTNLIHYNQLDRGGHFAAWEQPDLFVQEVRDCFRRIREPSAGRTGLRSTLL